MTTLSPGDRLYKYELERKIGGGHFGEVWLAQDLVVSRQLAVKILDESMAPVAASLDEARLGNKLNHGNVVRIHYADVIAHAGGKLVVIAMDHHAKGSIQSLLNAGKFLNAPTAVAVVVDVLRGLEYLHEQNFLHNDIKPSNILIGDDSRALLTDYGISRVLGPSGSATSTVAYTLHRAPETTASDLTSVQSDIYQVGMTLFRLVNGVETLEKRRAALGAVAFERLKSTGRLLEFALFVDARLKRVIVKATAAAPAKRFHSALEMRRALERIRFKGYWDADPSGDLFGIEGSNKFTFTVRSTGSNHEMQAYRENLKSRRKTKVSRHCHKGLSEAQLSVMQKKLMTDVIKGEL